MSPAPKLDLVQLDLSSEDVPAMVRFYDEFFGANLKPFDGAGATFFRGELHALRLLICPNEIAGVEASHNRHQFNYTTNDLDGAIAAAEAAGGSIRERAADSATILDPDGNSIVITDRAGAAERIEPYRRADDVLEQLRGVVVGYQDPLGAVGDLDSDELT